MGDHEADGHVEGLTDEAGLEDGRLLFAQESRFLSGAVDARGLPEYAQPEVAFAGRSNVGKSSLINALTGRKMLARTSNTPGRTREINFFDMGGRLILVDMPGYGFAAAPKTAIKRWNALIQAYLKGRPVLRRLCLLIDARHGLKPSDRDLMKMLDTAAVVYQIVLTKADKVPAAERGALVQGLQRDLLKHPAAMQQVLATSARTGEGIPELRAALAALARDAALG
ncbi:MAG: ribosome biogenesis GTP-binding protein YihA/YsxC [Alphaproteobacteria bacterium]